MKNHTPIPEIISEYFFQQEIQFQTTTGEPFEVPVCSSLGLLAMGFRGLVAWRKKKLETQNTPTNDAKISQ